MLHRRWPGWRVDSPVWLTGHWPVTLAKWACWVVRPCDGGCQAAFFGFGHAAMPCSQFCCLEQCGVCPTRPLRVGGSTCPTRATGGCWCNSSRAWRKGTSVQHACEYGPSKAPHSVHVQPLWLQCAWGVSTVVCACGAGGLWPFVARLQACIMHLAARGGLSICWDLW